MSGEELIIRHALESPEHLQVAWAVRESFDRIVKTVISKFLDDLGRECELALGEGWKAENLNPEKLKGEQDVFYLGKEQWISKLAIAIGLDKSRVYVGMKKRGALQVPEKDVAELQAIFKKISGGRADESATWIAWWYVPDKVYAWWDEGNPEAFIRMYFQKEAVQYFRGLLTRCAEPVFPVLDRIFR